MDKFVQIEFFPTIEQIVREEKQKREEESQAFEDACRADLAFHLTGGGSAKEET